MAELYPQTVKCVSVSSYRIFALLIFLCSQSKIQVTVRMTFAMFICWSNDVMCRAHSHTLKLSPSQSQVFNHTHTTLSLRPTACKENKRPLTFTSTRQGARVCGLLLIPHRHITMSEIQTISIASHEVRTDAVKSYVSYCVKGWSLFLSHTHTDTLIPKLRNPCINSHDGHAVMDSLSEVQ